MKKIFILLLFFSLLCADDLKNEFKRVYLVTIDNIDEHWTQVYKGANDALVESGKKIVLNWFAPNNKNDLEQLRMLKYTLSNEANVIIISLNSPIFLNKTIEEASKKGVKFIFIDSNADMNASQVIQTDNFAAGKTAAKEMLKALKAKKITSGNVGIINVNPYTQSLSDREKGFREAMQNEGFRVFSTRYSDGELLRAQNESQMLLKLGVVGLFSTNEGVSKGVSAAIKKTKSDVVVIGFDWPNNEEMFEKVGTFSAVIKQNPYKMGYESMNSAIKLLNQEALDYSFIDTGIEVITK